MEKETSVPLPNPTVSGASKCAYNTFGECKGGHLTFMGYNVGPDESRANPGLMEIHARRIYQSCADVAFVLEAHQKIIDAMHQPATPESEIRHKGRISKDASVAIQSKTLTHWVSRNGYKVQMS